MIRLPPISTRTDTLFPSTTLFRSVLLEQDPAVAGFSSLQDYALQGPDAPALHEVAAVADQIGVDLSREAATASGGESRRAAIARALAMNPDVLLLDETTTHLDLISEMRRVGEARVSARRYRWSLDH